LAKSRKVRNHASAQSYGSAQGYIPAQSQGFVPGYGFPPGFESSRCAPHYDSAGVADGCL
jgi:hypothetical protein